MAYQRVITVRMPPALHEALKQQAHEDQKSLNELCIDRLLYGTGLKIVKVEASLTVQPAHAEEAV